MQRHTDRFLQAVCFLNERFADFCTCIGDYKACTGSCAKNSLACGALRHSLFIITMKAVLYNTLRHGSRSPFALGRRSHIGAMRSGSCSDNDEPATVHTCTMWVEQCARCGRNPHLVALRPRARPGATVCGRPRSYKICAPRSTVHANQTSSAS